MKPTNLSFSKAYARSLVVLFVALALPFFFASRLALEKEQVKDEVSALRDRAGFAYRLVEYDTHAKLQALKYSAGLLHADSIDAITRQRFERAIGGIPGVVWSGLTDVDGKVVFATGGVLEGADVSFRPWFKEGQIRPHVADKHEALLLASKLPKRADTYQFIDMSVPVISDSGSLLGVLALHLDWGWYEAQFPQLLEISDRQSDVSVIVIGADNELRMSKLAPTATLAERDRMLDAAIHPNRGLGPYWLSEFVPKEGSYMRSLGWRVVALEPRKSGVFYQFSATVLGLIGLALGMLAVAWYTMHRIRRLSAQVTTHLSLLEQGSPLELNRSESQLPLELLNNATKLRHLNEKAVVKARRLTQALEMAENSYAEIDGLIQQAPICIAMFNHHMRYMACSDKWAKTYFTSEIEPRGQSHYDLVANIPESWRIYHRRGLKGERISKNGDSWVDGEGNRHWLDWVIEPWYGKNGKVGGIILVTQDKTSEYKAIEAMRDSEERFSLAMMGASDGLYDWDVTRNSIYYSPRWKQMLGYEPEELIDEFSTWEELLHPEDRQVSLDEVNRVVFDSEDLAFQMSFRLKHKDGHWVNVLSRGTIVRDPECKPTRVVGTHLDRTETDKLSDQLRQAQVIALSESKSNEAKSKFLATVSHEIRNPMNAISGFARLIHDETTSDDVKRYAKLLNLTTDSLRLILNDILDYAKIEAGKLEVVPGNFHLPEMMEGMAEATRFQCSDKAIAFTYKPMLNATPYVIGDAVRIRQVCQNLLSNAIKFTTQGGVTLGVSMTETADAKCVDVRIVVEDTGIGIAEDKMEDVCKPFSQLHRDPTNAFGGTGLGLSIVKALVEQMDGRLQIESVYGRGSAFTVTFTMPVGIMPVKEVLNPEAHTDSKRVLVVDDVPVNSQILKVFLGKRGHRVHTFQSSVDALQLMQVKAFDVVLLDLDMPVLDGTDILRQIREGDGPCKDAYFVCVTGHALAETAERTRLAGFDEFCAKPVDFDRLARLVADAPRLEEIT